jgi:hypothetical protein
MSRMREATSGIVTRTGRLVAVLCLLAANVALAQSPNQDQDERVVRAEAPIVAGNAVNAKKRALADAFRQAAERSLGDLLKLGEPLPQPMPVGVAQLKASLANSAQKFIRSYRLIEESTEGGVMRVMVEADVDTVLLRRELDRLRGAGTAPARAAATAPVAGFLLVAGTAPVAAMTAKALAAAGARVRLDPATGESQLLVSAGKQNAYALYVVATSASEGMVRGAGRISVRCNVRSRLFPAGVRAQPTIDRVDEERGFAAQENLARDACFERVSGQAARRLVTLLRAPTVSAPFVSLQLDIADPGAIPTFLQALARLGAVTATEVRQVSPSQAEIRVFAGKLTLVPTQTTNGSIAMRVRALDSSAVEENH